jgi:CRP-like cAMP-binding protein
MLAQLHCTTMPNDTRSSVPYDAVCIGCPAQRMNVFESLVHGGRGWCQMPSIALQARQVLPATWQTEYAYAFVRRGFVVRQINDENGDTSSVDVAGPGCLLTTAALPPLHSRVAISGYAANDALICALSVRVVENVVSGGGDHVRELVALLGASARRVEMISYARSQKDAARAVASLLLTLSSCLAPPAVLSTIPNGLQQRDLAALLGIRHETMSRVITDFEKRGVVARGEDGIQLISLDALRSGLVS